MKIWSQTCEQMEIQISDRVENIVDKEKLLVTSNFSFSHNVFKSSLFLMRENEYLWSKGLLTVLVYLQVFVRKADHLDESKTRLSK